MIKLNLKNGIAIFIVMIFLFFIGFYFFRILAFAAQGGSGHGVKFFFWFLLFIIEFIGIYGFLAPICGFINDYSKELRINWSIFTLFSIFFTVIAFLLTKGPIGL